MLTKTYAATLHSLSGGQTARDSLPDTKSHLQYRYRRKENPKLHLRTRDRVLKEARERDREGGERVMDGVTDRGQHCRMEGGGMH